jgi:hypothetical protein
MAAPNKGIIMTNAPIAIIPITIYPSTSIIKVDRK